MVATVADMIRAARPDDIPEVLRLIRELARYEREPDAVEATEGTLMEALFGAEPQAFAHVAEEGGTIVGLAVWFVSFSTWTGRHGIYLEDLVISPEARGGGHGRALMGELARICAERGYTRLEWSVLDWNVDAQQFYSSLGAVPMPEWIGWRLSGRALTALA